MGWGFEDLDEYDQDDEGGTWIDWFKDISEYVGWGIICWLAWFVVPDVCRWFWGFLRYVWPWTPGP